MSDKKTDRKKGKYFYNPELMQYESVRQTLVEKVMRWLSFLIITFLIAAVYYFAFSVFFDTPTESAKQEENKRLELELEKMNKTYQVLEKLVDNLEKRDTSIYRAIFEANPLNIDNLSEGHDYTVFERLSNTELIAASQTELADVRHFTQRTQIDLDTMQVLFEANAQSLLSIPGIQPVENTNLLAAGASVGPKINPFFKSIRTHTGMDFAVPVGSKVMATADGTVTEIWYSQLGAGNRIVINHGNNYETRYLYLSEILVKRGAKVSRGQMIGRVGNLGMTVPHLHYEVRKGGKIADPLNFFFLELNPQQYQQIMAISLNNGQSLD